MKYIFTMQAHSDLKHKQLTLSLHTIRNSPKETFNNSRVSRLEEFLGKRAEDLVFNASVPYLISIVLKIYFA